MKQFPVAKLLRAEQVDKDPIGDAQLQKILGGKFDGIERDIERSSEGINRGDVPYHELDGIIPSVFQQLPENQRAEVSQYIQQKKKTEATVSAATAGAEILLTLFGVFSGGGILSSIYYGVAGALGLSTAAYEFERASDLNTIANAQKVGGATELLSDPDSAKRGYVFAWANLTLGLIDSGVAIAEGGKLLPGATAAEVLATHPGADALYTVPKNKILEIQSAIDLERAGDPAAQQALAALKQELGTDFDSIYDTLGNGNLRVVGEAEAELLGGAGIGDVPSSPAKSRLLQIRESLTPEGQALFDREFKISGSNADEYLGSLESKKDPTKYLNGRGAAEARRASGGQQAAQQAIQQRRKTALEKLRQSGFVNRQDVLDIVENLELDYPEKVKTLRGKIAVEQAVQRAKTQYPAEQGYEVLEEVDVAEAVGNYRSLDEWKAAHPGQDPNGLYQLSGRVWRQKTDIDVMVVQKTPDGKYQTVEIQEVKSGKNDSPSKAKEQSNNGRNGLQEINDGSNDIQLHQGKENITGRFDRGKIAVTQDNAMTVGPAQKKQGGNGFDQVGESTTNDYNNLAKEILTQHGVTE